MNILEKTKELNKKPERTTTVLHNGLGLVFPSEKPLRIEILSIFVMVSLESQATDAKQQNVSGKFSYGVVISGVLNPIDKIFFC